MSSKRLKDFFPSRLDLELLTPTFLVSFALGSLVNKSLKTLLSSAATISALDSVPSLIFSAMLDIKSTTADCVDKSVGTPTSLLNSSPNLYIKVLVTFLSLLILPIRSTKPIITSSGLKPLSIKILLPTFSKSLSTL